MWCDIRIRTPLECLSGAHAHASALVCTAPCCQNRWIYFVFGHAVHDNHTVFGKSLQLPKIENPTHEDVDKWHAIYTEALKVTRIYRYTCIVYDISLCHLCWSQTSAVLSLQCALAKCCIYRLLSVNKSLPKWRVCTKVAVSRLHCSLIRRRKQLLCHWC